MHYRDPDAIGNTSHLAEGNWLSVLSDRCDVVTVLDILQQEKHMPISFPQVCPVMVGRDAELQVLSNLLDRTHTGDGSMSLISGEAGIGKTRLQREFVDEARQRKFRIVTGICTERDRDFPFAPFVDAVRQGLGERQYSVDQLPSAVVRALASLLPELDDRVPDPAHADHAELLAEQQKRRVFEAFVTLFRHLAKESPLVLILEDIHWADPSSLELIELLPRRLTSSSVLVVATARADEHNRELERSLGALRRQRALVDIVLNRLDDGQIDTMLAALLDEQASAVLSNSIRARTDGNPFFVEELLVSWQSGGEDASAIPETVREAVLRRLDAVGTPARYAASLAAVIGKRFTMDLLVACSDLSPDTLLVGIEDLIKHHILVEEPAARQSVLSFRHALTREVIQSLSLIHQRVVQHGQVGEALLAMRERDAPVRSSDLGYHFFMAHDWPRALEYATKAGDNAWSVHSTAEALVHYRRALDAALEIGHQSATRLLLLCGRCHALLGSFDDARYHLEEALRRSRLEGDAGIEHLALYELAGLYSSRDYRVAQRLADDALKLSRLGNDRRQEGRALNRLGNILTNLLHFDDSRALQEEALAVFDGAGERWGVADSLDLIGMNYFLSGNIHDARSYFDRAATMFDALDDAERFASARTSQGCYIAVLDGPCSSPVPASVFRAEAEEGLQRCRSIGWRSGEAYAHASIACAAVGEGRLDVAWEHAQAGLAIATDIEHQQWIVICQMTLGLIHVDMLDDAGAIGHFSEALELATAMGASQWEQRASAWVQRCRYRLGERGQARSMSQSMVGECGPPASIGERRVILTLAEMDFAEGHFDDSLSRVNRLLDGNDQAHPAEVVLMQARIFHSLGQEREADAAYLLARKQVVRGGPRPLLWKIAAGRSLLWRGGNPGRSEREAKLARNEIDALSAALPDVAARRHLLSHADVRIWLPASRTPRTARSTGPGGLTRRERDVAGHVAAGLANKEIASVLSIAEKTVEMHVSNCLGKLDLTSRTQLAGWVMGLDRSTLRS